MDSQRRITTGYRGSYVPWFALLLLLTILNGPSQAQTPVKDCKVGSQAAATGFWTWPPDSQVYVFVVQNDFLKEEILLLTQAVKLWDAVSETTESKVRLTYAGPTVAPRDCENCLTLRRGNVHSGKTRHGSEIRAFGINGTRVIHHATVVIDPRMKTSVSLSSAVAHELGHSFGLKDCYNCKDRSTVMIKFSGFNASNGLDGPTACDIAQVKKAYTELKRYRLAVVHVDEGEEPVPDDTPLVIPEP